MRALPHLDADQLNNIMPLRKCRKVPFESTVGEEDLNLLDELNVEEGEELADDILPRKHRKATPWP